MKNLMIIIFILVIVSCSTSNKYIDKPVDPNRVKGQTPKRVIYEDAPFAIKHVRANYPIGAKQNGIEGDVWLEVEVLEDGSVGTINVVQSLMPGPGGLDEAAVAAVKQWQFRPAKNNGKPVACWVTFPVGFRLN